MQAFQIANLIREYIDVLKSTLAGNEAAAAAAQMQGGGVVYGSGYGPRPQGYPVSILKKEGTPPPAQPPPPVQFSSELTSFG